MSNRYAERAGVTVRVNEGCTCVHIMNGAVAQADATTLKSGTGLSVATVLGTATFSVDNLAEASGTFSVEGVSTLVPAIALQADTLYSFTANVVLIDDVADGTGRAFGSWQFAFTARIDSTGLAVLEGPVTPLYSNLSAQAGVLMWGAASASVSGTSVSITVDRGGVVQTNPAYASARITWTEVAYTTAP